METGKNLDSHQGKVKGFLQTCGIVACVNVFRLLGIKMTEEALVNYASKAKSNGHPLCETGRLDCNNGGTTPETRKEILSAFGIESTCEECTVESIARRVEEGRGVIISVDCDKLYSRAKYSSDKLSGSTNFHAVLVTSTVRNADGSLRGFYVCDSNDYPSEFYYMSEIKDSLIPERDMNVTNIILR